MVGNYTRLSHDVADTRKLIWLRRSTCLLHLPLAHPLLLLWAPSSSSSSSHTNVTIVNKTIESLVTDACDHEFTYYSLLTYITVFTQQETDIHQAEIIKVIPLRHKGSGALCKIHHGQVCMKCWTRFHRMKITKWYGREVVARCMQNIVSSLVWNRVKCTIGIDIPKTGS